MTFMTIAAKSAPLFRSAFPLCLHAPLAHSRFFALSCNLFFSLLYFTLFSLRFHFLVVCQSLLISLPLSGLTLKGKGVYGRKRLPRKPTSCKNPTPTTQLSHFFSFVKFTSAIPEIMSNIPRAMPKKKIRKKRICRKLNTNKKKNSREFHAIAGKGVGVASASVKDCIWHREQIINRQAEGQRIVIF